MIGETDFDLLQESDKVEFEIGEGQKDPRELKVKLTRHTDTKVV